MFVVVVFDDHNEVDVVASNWVINKTHTYWPPFKSSQQINKAVRERINPDAEVWKIYEMRVLCACGKEMSFPYILCIVAQLYTL